MSTSDQVLQLVGNIGRWQWYIVYFTAFSFLLNTWAILVMSFLTPKLEYFCQPNVVGQGGGGEGGGQLQDANYSEWKSVLDPLMDEINEKENKSDLLPKCNALTYDPNAGVMEVTNETCTSWVYDKSFYKQTVVTEFDLVCSSDYLVTISQSMYMFGILCGVVICGIISDKYGRKYTIMGTATALLIFGVSASFANSFALFIVLRYVIAFTGFGCITTAFVMCMEIIGGKWNVLIGIGLEFAWAFGYAILPLIAYYIPQWTWLHLVVSLPTLLFIPLTFLIPESPRWLLSQGRLEEAEEILRGAVRINGGQWPNSVKLEQTTEEASANLTDLFRTPNLRKKTIIQWFLWFTCSFVYYGLTLNTGTLIPGGDFHINFLVAGLVEFPAYGLTILVLLNWGRRLPLSGMFFLCGVCYVIVVCTPEKYTMTLLVIASIGKFGVTAAFATVYVYAAELFPTVLRQTGLGSSSMCARIGSFLAPPVGRQLGQVNRTIPMLIFAAVSIIGGLATLALPETKGHTLPESVQEGEEFGKGQKICDWRTSAPISDKPSSEPQTENKGFQMN